MSKEERKVPELRFRGFHDDWEQRELGDLSNKLEYGLNASATDYDGINKYIRITDIDDSTNEFISDNLTSPNTDLYLADNYLLKQGDILFARTGASVGKTYIYNEKDGKVYYAGFLIRARINSNTNPEFIFQNTLTRKYENFVRVTSQRSGQPGINANEYKKYQITIPQINEQNEISDFLISLDKIVVLHQRKINTLEALKKVYLNGMFTNKGDNIPILRFKNFTEPWEQRKFKNFVENISTGRSSFISGKLQSNKNKFPILGSTNPIGYDSTYDYSGNFILTARVGANAGNIYRFQGDVKISDNTVYIQTKNLIFTYYLLLNFNLKRLAFGTGQPLIKASEIGKITFRLPSTAKEYRKIGECLNNIDNLTILHQSILETLKKLKQIYLTKMFI